MSFSSTEQAQLSIDANSGVEQYLKMAEALQKNIKVIERLEEMRINTAEAIEDLWEKKRNINEYIKCRYTLAKDEGFDPEAMKTTVRRRAATAVEVDDPDEYLNCPDSLFEDYEAALELERPNAFGV